MKSAKKELRAIRPKLRHIAPMTFLICWGYAATNILLGLAMYFFFVPPQEPIAVANILSYQEWGIVYGVVGVITAWGLFINNWRLVKHSQMVGLIIKAIWALALIMRSIVAPQTLTITVIWLFFAYIQAVTYIYFLPRTENHHAR